MLDANKRHELSFSRDIIDFLVKIVPSDYSYIFTKKCIDFDLITHLETIKKKLIVFVKNEVVKFEVLVDEFMDFLTSSFFSKNIDLLINLIDLENLYQKLNAIEAIGSKRAI